MLHVYNNEKRFNIISLKNNLSDILELDNFDTFKYYIIFLENINNINKERKVSLIKIKKNFLKNYLNKLIYILKIMRIIIYKKILFHNQMN